MNNYPLPDQQLAAYTNKTLARLAPAAISGEKNFFIALGFYKPHLPFVFPESYLNEYPSSDIYLPTNPYVPNNFHEKAWSDYNELRKYGDITVDGTY